MTRKKLLFFLVYSILIVSCENKLSGNVNIGDLELGEHISENPLCANKRPDDSGTTYCTLVDPDIDILGVKPVEATLTYNFRKELTDVTVFTVMINRERRDAFINEMQSKYGNAFKTTTKDKYNTYHSINHKSGYVFIRTDYLIRCFDVNSEPWSMHYDCSGTNSDEYKNGIRIQISEELN